MRKILFLLFCLLFFISCGVNRVYTPANYGALKKYTAKPVYKDQRVSHNYISVSLSEGEHPYSGLENPDTKLIGTLNIHKSTSFKKNNFYYGIGISYGKFNFKNSLDNVILKNETSNFYGINPKIGFSIKKSSSSFELHYIGMELNYNYENGDYQEKISSILPSESIRVVNVKSMFSVNYFSELIYKINPNNEIGFGIFAGTFIGLNEEKYNIRGHSGIGFNGITLSYRFKKTTLSLVIESAAEKIHSSNFGISYQL